MAMSIQEYKELMDEINAHHGWNHMWENSEAGRKIVKYVNATFDTRDGKDGEGGEFWAVKVVIYNLISNIKAENPSAEFVFQEEKCTKDYILGFLRNN